MSSLHTMRFAFEEAPIAESKEPHSIDITKRFDSWVEGHTLATLITEFAYCLLAMTFNKETVKEMMLEVAESL